MKTFVSMIFKIVAISVICQAETQMPYSPSITSYISIAADSDHDKLSPRIGEYLRYYEPYDNRCAVNADKSCEFNTNRLLKKTILAFFNDGNQKARFLFPFIFTNLGSC